MKKIITTAVVLFLLAAGCGPATQITSSWKAENVQPAKYKKMVVLGLVRENDRTIRERLEQHVVGDLRELGYDAVCSCDEYNPKAFENMSEDQAITKLRESGVDAVLTVVLLDKTQERYYVPGRVVYSPYMVYQGRFWRYSRVMYDRIYTEGYYSTNTKYFWESNLYDMASNTLVYSSQSQSFDPFSAESLAHSYGQMIVKDMVKKNVLADLKQPVLKAM